VFDAIQNANEIYRLVPVPIDFYLFPGIAADSRSIASKERHAAQPDILADFVGCVVFAGSYVGFPIRFFCELMSATR
jgi:hypothetical protein